MRCRMYVEALLVDEELADQVWEAWHGGEMQTIDAVLIWLCIAATSQVCNAD